MNMQDTTHSLFVRKFNSFKNLDDLTVEDITIMEKVISDVERIHVDGVCKNIWLDKIKEMGKIHLLKDLIETYQSRYDFFIMKEKYLFAIEKEDSLKKILFTFYYNRNLIMEEMREDVLYIYGDSYSVSDIYPTISESAFIHRAVYADRRMDTEIATDDTNIELNFDTEEELELGFNVENDLSLNFNETGINPYILQTMVKKSLGKITELVPLDEIEDVESVSVKDDIPEVDLKIDIELNETLTSVERKKLKDSDFGIPSLRKYPLHDERHVFSAIRFFNYVDTEHEAELAKNIIKAAKKFKITLKPGKKNRLREYLKDGSRNISETISLLTEASKKPSWDPNFYPCYTPKEMLALGVFEGKYLNDDTTEYPADWFKGAKTAGVDGEPDITLNKYGVKSRQSLKEWKAKGWIKPQDPKGWFQWYCRYYEGRRSSDDARQIGRWRSFVARHQGQIVANCKLSDDKCRPRQRQGLLQWAWDSSKKFDDPKVREENLKKLKVEITNESFNKLKSVPDFEYKIEEWKAKKNRFLFISGISGSGKTTLAKKMAEEYKAKLISLDDIGSEFIDSVGQEKIDKMNEVQYSKAVANYVLGIHKYGQVIVEGVGFLEWFEDIPSMKNQSYIIKGTSYLKSTIQAAKRDKKTVSNTTRDYFKNKKAFEYYAIRANELKSILGGAPRVLEPVSESVKKNINLKNLESVDYIYKFEEFVSKKNNVIYVTGLSGSGKSTLSKEIERVYNLDGIIELDNFEHGIDSKCPFIKEYISLNPKLLPYFEDHWSEGDFLAGFKNYWTWITNKLKKSKKRYVVEGVQILYLDIQKAISSNDSLIIKMADADVSYKRALADKSRMQYDYPQQSLEKIKKMEKLRNHWRNNHISLWNVGYYESVSESVRTTSYMSLYHLSENSKLSGNILHPRIPNNYMTKNGYEEDKTPRISFARSIDGALIGLSDNLKDKTFYVYTIDNEYSEPKIKNVTNKDVPDQSLTSEVWVLNDIKLKLIGSIKITGSYETPLKYKYGENIAETYRWKYKEIELESLAESAVIRTLKPKKGRVTSNINLHLDDKKLVPLFVVLTKNDTPVGNAIRTVTREKYNHASFAIDYELNSMYSFAMGDDGRGGMVIESKKEGRFHSLVFRDVNPTEYALYVTFVSREKYAKIEERLNDMIVNIKEYKYNMLQLFKLPLGIKNRNKRAMICSEFVGELLKYGDNSLVIDKHTSLLTPKDVVSPKFYFVSDGYMKDYDPKDTKKKISQLMRSNEIYKYLTENVNQIASYMVFKDLFSKPTYTNTKYIINTFFPYFEGEYEVLFGMTNGGMFHKFETRALTNDDLYLYDPSKNVAGADLSNDPYHIKFAHDIQRLVKMLYVDRKALDYNLSERTVAKITNISAEWYKLICMYYHSMKASSNLNTVNIFKQALYDLCWNPQNDPTDEDLFDNIGILMARKLGVIIDPVADSNIDLDSFYNNLKRNEELIDDRFFLTADRRYLILDQDSLISAIYAYGNMIDIEKDIFMERWLERYYDLGCKFKIPADTEFGKDLPDEYRSLLSKRVEDIINEGLKSKVFNIELNDDGSLRVKNKLPKPIREMYKDSLRNIKIYKKSNNIEGLKHEALILKYMIDLVTTTYMNPKTNKYVAKDKYKEMMDLRAIMINSWSQTIAYIISIEPDFNFAKYYDESEYGKDIKITQNELKFSLQILGKAIKSLISL